MEEDFLDNSTDEWVELVNDQSFMELLNQSIWDVESVDDGHNGKLVYPELLGKLLCF